MKSRVSAFILIAAMLSAGCDIFNKKDDEETTPTGPTAGVSLDGFAGTWSSVTPSTPTTGCGNVKYTVIPTTASSANVAFAATCGGNITVNGSGAGAVSGSALNWNVSGLVAQGGVNCPFTFSNNKATLDATGQILMNYSGTVCGIPVSGSETVKR